MTYTMCRAMFLSVTLLAMLGCRGRATPDPDRADGAADRPAPADLASAEQVVRAYFGAVAAEDCGAMAAVTQPPVTAAECADTLRDFQSHGASFQSVVKSTPDGRDPTAILVTARMRVGTDERNEVFRVERVGNEQRLRW